MTNLGTLELHIYMAITCNTNSISQSWFFRDRNGSTCTDAPLNSSFNNNLDTKKCFAIQAWAMTNLRIKIRNYRKISGYENSRNKVVRFSKELLVSFTNHCNIEHSEICKTHASIIFMYQQFFLRHPMYFL